MLDTIAPLTPAVSFTTTGTAGPTKYTNHPKNLALAVSLSDGTGSGLSVMRVGETLDGSGNVSHPTEPYKVDAVLTRSVTIDGPQSVRVQVIDHAGNVSAVGSDAIIVDTIAPTGTIRLSDGPRATDVGYTNTPFVTVNETWADGDGGTVLIKLSNTSADLNAAVYGPASLTAGWFLDPVGETLKTVYATFRDLAGNESVTAATAAITYDLTPPTPASVSVIGATTRADPVVVLALTTNPADLSTTSALTLSDEATFTSAAAIGPSPFPGSAQASFTLPPGEGSRTIYVRFRDRAGNDSVASTQVTLDTQAPTGSFTLLGTLADGTPSPSITSSLSVTVNLTAGGASEYRLGDATMTNCPSTGYLPIVTPTLTSQALAASGVMTVCLRDAAHNTQGPLTQSLQVITSAPGGCGISLAGTKVDGTPAPAGKTARASVSMTVAGCTFAPLEMAVTTAPAITCSNAAMLNWQPYSTASSQTLSGPDATFTVRGCVRDAARNVGTMTAGSILLDTAGPTAPSLSLDVGAPYVNGAQVTARGGYLASALGTAIGATEWALSTTSSPSAFVASTGAASSFTFPSSDGARTLYALFRDDVGNLSSLATANITFDTVAPSVTSSSVTLNPGGNGSTDTTLLTAQLIYPVDGVSVQLANAVAVAACALSDFSAAPVRATASVMTFSLGSGEGLKRVCAQFVDPAGNVSSIISGTITLDTLAPTSCALSLTGKKVNGAAAPVGRSGTASVTASIASCNELPASMVLSQSALTCTGAASLPWVAYSASSTFLLSGPDGTNSVNGCVRDAAGNVSALTSGSITLDTTPPESPTLSLDSAALYVNAAQVTSRGGYIASAAGSATGATEWALAESGTPGSFVPLVGAINFTFTSVEGLHTLRAVFADDVGNLSTTASASITFDTVAPNVAAASLTVNPGGNGFTNSVSAVTRLTGVVATDANEILFGSAAGPVACALSDLSSPLRMSYTTGAFVTLLNAGDGTKRICAQVSDRAGNVSGLVPTGGTIVLDTTAPSAPVITTAGAVTSSPDNTPFTVTLASGVTETNFDRYEVLGGKIFAWTSASTLQGTTTFAFNLASTALYPAGYDNVLKVRAVDRAGNSSESFVIVTTDISSPEAVTLNARWVSNGDKVGTLAWDGSRLTSDVVGYRIYYGTSSGLYTGTYAAGGPSPIFVADPSADRATLAGLLNSTQTYVTVRAVDHAGNEGDPTSEVMLQPNLLSPNLIGTVNLGSYGLRMVSSDTTLYTLGIDGACSNVYLRAIELSGLVSPMQGGVAQNPLPALPVPSPAVQWAGTTCDFSDLVDLQRDGMYLFAATGHEVRIFSLADSASPALVTTLSLGASYHAQALAVRGPLLFVGGYNGNAGSPGAVITAVDLNKLYNSVADVPSLPADILGQATNAGWTGNPYAGLIWNRNKLVWANGSTSTYNIGAVFSHFPLADGDQVPGVGVNYYYPRGSPPTSGNLSYSNDHFSGLQLIQLNTLWLGGRPYSQMSPLSTAGAIGGYAVDIAGAQAFFSDEPTSGLRMFDLSDAARPVDLGTLRMQSGAINGPAVHIGNYLAVLSSYELQLFELATPQAPRLVSQLNAGGESIDVIPGFAFAGGSVIDLHAGTALTSLGSVNTCSWASAPMDETLIRASGNELIILDLERLTDRDGSTAPVPWEVYSVALGAGVSARAVRTIGSYFIVAEQRADGSYLEVFNGTKIRDRLSGTNFDPVADLAGSIKVTGVQGGLDLFLYRGRAFLSVSSATGGVWAVDLRNALDDNPATTLTAASLQGSVSSMTPGAGATTAAVSGNVLSMLSGGDLYSGTLETIDVSPALDDNPLTLISATPLRGSLTVSGAALSVAGSYAYIAGPFGFSTIDVSSPFAPTLIAQAPVGISQSGSCFNTSDGFITSKARMTVQGTRAFVEGLFSLLALELE